MQNDPLRCHELKYPYLSYPYLFPLILSGDMYLPADGEGGDLDAAAAVEWQRTRQGLGLASFRASAFA